MIRPGRFDRKIHIPEPNLESRKKLFAHYLSKVRIPKRRVELDRISSVTGGFTGADIKNLVNIASMDVTFHNKNNLDEKDLFAAYELMKMGVKRKKSMSDADDLLRTAYHESGHALTSLLVDGSLELNKVTILPVGGALG